MSGHRISGPLRRTGGERKRTYAAVRASRNMSPAERIKLHVKADENGCWIWQLALVQQTGYGSLSIDGKILRAHRVSYEAFVGPIPDGLSIDHLCRNRACVNPDHLEPVTPLENTRRGHHPNVLATHCPRRHEYDEANTYRWKGRRQCRTCVTARNRLYKAMTPDERAERAKAGLPIVDLDAYFAAPPLADSA